MYNWLIVFTLKSGKEIQVIHEGPETSSSEVAGKVLAGGFNSMNGFYNTTKTHTILVLVGEVAAMDISEWRGH